MRRQNIKLNKEEQELEDSFENLVSSKTAKKDLSIAKNAAKNYLNKDSRINIRISSSDLNIIKRIAVQEGLPYQTLISSVLHKYAAGRFGT